MAERTVRDCDRCGARDISDEPISKHLSSGTRIDIDLCASCKNATFSFVVRNLNDTAFISLRNAVTSYRGCTSGYADATPNDMRP